MERVSFYAQTNNPLSDEAGANLNIPIGGINENAPEDNIGPVINLFMNDENFVSGGITNESPTFNWQIFKMKMVLIQLAV
jgi:hypothetical protein